VSRKLHPERQAGFIKAYEDLLNQLEADEVVLFADAVHPTHAVRSVGCWAPKDTPIAVAQTSGRLAVGAALAFLPPTLIGEERGAAHEEQGEGGQHDVGHAVGVVTERPIAGVGEGGRDGAHAAPVRSESRPTGAWNQRTGPDTREMCARIGERSAGRRRLCSVADRSQSKGTRRSHFEVLFNR